MVFLFLVDLKREKIAELLEYIKERLHELEGEKEELGRFQALDRQRRTCEHLLYSREQMDIMDALEQAEEEYKAVCKTPRCWMKSIRRIWRGWEGIG